MMIQVRRKLHIPVPSRRNVKITLHLIRMHRPINATTVRLHASPYPRRLTELLTLPRRAQIIVHVLLPVLLILPEPRVAAQIQSFLLRGTQTMHATPRLAPLVPGRCIPMQRRASEDAVAAGVLDIDMQVLAFHGYDKIEIDLQIPSHALLDGECVRRVALPPPSQFTPREP